MPKGLLFVAFVELLLSFHVDSLCEVRYAKYGAIVCSQKTQTGSSNILSQVRPQVGPQYFSSSKLRLRGGSSELGEGENSKSQDGSIYDLKKMITSQFEDLFSDNWKQELGYVCLGFGAFFLASALNPIPFFGLWMNRKAIILSNIMIIAGSTLLVGFLEMKRFFLTKSRLVGSVLILAGFIALWKDSSERWTVLAFLVQLLGMVSLFGPYAQSFFRFATQFLFPMIFSIPSKLFRTK
jgi:hypothetical protein